MEKMDGGGSGGGGGPGAYRIPRHIMIGIDGTWQAAFSDPFHSNVFRLNIALNYRDNSVHERPQFFIYSAGVGTAVPSSSLRAGAIGEGLDELILEAYINLVSNYSTGDLIYIFGFSRGAVAARALTGLISTAGLLKAEASSMIEDAWRFFTDTGARDYLSRKAANTHSKVKVEFLGVWDTVSGPYKQYELFRRYRLKNLALDPIVKHGIHVVAADESRSDFRPMLWTRKSDSSQTLEQIWLPGVHTDIGGGYQRAFLSTVSLLIMIDKLASSCPDLGFDDHYIRQTLMEILRIEDIVVNDEWAEYWARYIKWAARWMIDRRTVPSSADHFHVLHPLVHLLHGKPVRFKNKNSAYKSLCQLDSTLSEVSFSDKSWHQSVMRGVFERKLG